MRKSEERGFCLIDCGGGFVEKDKFAIASRWGTEVTAHHHSRDSTIVYLLSARSAAKNRMMKISKT